MVSVVIQLYLWGIDMELEDLDIVEVNDNDGIELTIKEPVAGGYIYIKDEELLKMCRMRGLID